MFALTWSVGASLDDDSRAKFDRFLREVSREASVYKLVVHFPKKGSIYDLLFDVDKVKWLYWSDELEQKKFEIPASVTLLIRVFFRSQYICFLHLIVNY